MGRFGGRVADLERKLGGGGCPACGMGSGRPLKVVPAADEWDGPEACPACGRSLVFTLKLGETNLNEEE